MSLVMCVCLCVHAVLWCAILHVVTSLRYGMACHGVVLYVMVRHGTVGHVTA